MLNHIAVMAATVIILMLNNNMILFILGDAFSESIRYVPVLLIGTVFLAYSNFCSPIYSAFKLSKHIMYTSLCGAVVNVVLNFLLIKPLGIMGACVATAVAYMVIAIIRLAESNKLIGIEYSKIKFTLSCCLIMLVGYLVTMQKAEVLSSLLCGILLIIIYFKDIRFYMAKLINLTISRRQTK